MLFRFTASAEIHRESYPLLNEIATIAARCAASGAKIEVSGHTDSQGRPERNQALSERRAKAVVDYLAKAGVDTGILTAVGYGEDRPIASNDTPEGMAQNRRIEMSVK